MNDDIAQFFTLDSKEKTVRFMGDKLECFIPIRYQMKNLLIIGSKVSALGIFTIRINDKITAGLQLPAVIEIEPSVTRNEAINGDSFFVCELHRGDAIMSSTIVMQNILMGYLMWLEFFSLGNLPSYVTYDGVSTMFDDVGEVTGKGIPVDHSSFEVIYARQFRDPDDLSVEYRHSSKTKPPAIVPLRDVAHNASSTMSRIVGAYAEDGRNAALLNQSDDNHTLEDFFRA